MDYKKLLVKSSSFYTKGENTYNKRIISNYSKGENVMMKYATIIEHVTNYNEDGARYITDEAILMIKDHNELYLKKVIAEAVERTTEYKNNKNAEIIINGNSEIGYTVNIINFTITTNVENILDFLN